MIKLKIIKLINEYGVSKLQIATVLNISRPTLDSRIADNSFTESEIKLFDSVYGKLFK